MDENEYFRRAAATQRLQNRVEKEPDNSKIQEEVLTKIEKPAKVESKEVLIKTEEKPKRGRKKKEAQEKPEPPKMPIYEFGRDNNGEAIIKAQKKEIRGINEQNFEIENNALDQFSSTIQKMIDEEYDKLTRCKIEIKILEKMYSLYNKDIYNSQIKSWKDRQFQSITRIRLLNELMEE